MFTSLLRSFRHLSFAEAQNKGTRLFSTGKHAWNMKRHHSDPEYRRQMLDRRIEYERRRRVQDPEYHEKQKLLFRELIRQERFREGYLKFEKMCKWIREKGWHEADLPWKTYRPELSPERIVRPCSGCNWPDRRAKFWWVVLTQKSICVVSVGGS